MQYFPLSDAVFIPDKREVVRKPTIVSLVGPCCNTDQKDHEDNKTMASGANNFDQAVHNTNGVLISTIDH